MYGLATIPLITRLDGLCKQVWYADDSAAFGTIEQLRGWWDRLTTEGPSFGYFANPSKTWLHGNQGQEPWRSRHYLRRLWGQHHPQRQALSRCSHWFPKVHWGTCECQGPIMVVQYYPPEWDREVTAPCRLFSTDARPIEQVDIPQPSYP